VATGHRFAKVFLHTGMVGLNGEKMSKSLGNLVFVSRLVADGVDPMAIRLVLLAHHYRTDWQYTASELSAAQARLAAWRAAFSAPAGAPGEPVVAALRAALRADLDSPSALAIIDEWALSGGADPVAPSLVASAADALLGIAAPSAAVASR
jgi:L-cysteine:1D-myo-inositol 2-amino-2-deoxy-alpha-D-glucopyranoside ligase